MMKQKLSDVFINYLMKGGVLMESKGENKIKIEIPSETEDGKEKKTTIEITFNDIVIRTVKEDEKN